MTDTPVTQADCREWFYYPIEMPLDADGNGPASHKEAVKIVYEVWDRCCDTFGSYEHLSDAINEAMRLNAQSEPSGDASQDELLKEIEHEWFDRGTIVAAAILLNVWGDTTQAAEILSAAGIDHKRAKELAEVEPDLEVVRFLAKQERPT